MKLQQFNGGLNTRLAPELLHPTEAVVCSNVDLSSGQVGSVKGLGSAVETLEQYPYYFEAEQTWMPSAHQRDYLEYQGKLYWTETGRAKKYNNGATYNLGINKPSSISASISSSLATPTISATVHAYNITFDILEVPSAGDFPAATSLTYYAVIYYGGKVVFSKSITVTTTTVNSGIDITIDFTAPAGASYNVGRLYGGTIREVPSLDYTYDVSGEAELITTVDASVIQPISSYSVACAITKDGKFSVLSSYKTATLSVPGWIEYTAIGTLGVGESFAYFMDNKLLSSNVIAFTPVLTAVDTSEGLNGTLQYVYTYYNNADGTESQPSPLSTELTVFGGAMNVALTASADPQVTHIIVYRIGGNLTVFTEVARLANTSIVYFDETKDSDLSTTVLTSSLNGAPPTGLRYLVGSHGVFFGALGEKLYFTRDIGNPNYWPETYYIDFDLRITGLTVTASGLIVFTKYATYLISGTNSSTFVKYLISSSQGCIEHKSIVQQEGSSLFISTDGLCVVAGQTIQVVSRPKLGKLTFDSGIINAVVYDDVYYCQLGNGRIFVFDARYTPALYDLDLATNWLVVAKDTLYGQSAEGSKTLFTGELVPFSYKTGKLTDGTASELKSYNEIYLSFEGTLTITIYIDDKIVLSTTKSGGAYPTEIAVPQIYQRGTTIQFEFTGIGKIKEVEYKFAGRENGR